MCLRSTSIALALAKLLLGTEIVEGIPSYLALINPWVESGKGRLMSCHYKTLVSRMGLEPRNILSIDQRRIHISTNCTENKHFHTSIYMVDISHQKHIIT